MYDCYRTLRDSGSDDPLRAEALDEVTRQLVEEAGQALARLTALG